MPEALFLVADGLADKAHQLPDVPGFDAFLAMVPAGVDLEENSAVAFVGVKPDINPEHQRGLSHFVLTSRSPGTVLALTPGFCQE
jgi:hypothetical protein